MGKDPSLKVIASRLETDAKEALDAFRAGNLNYSRYKLGRVSRDCFQCHSRTSGGPEFKDFNMNIHEAGLKPSELADIYAATRQFDRAIEVLQKSISSKEVAANERFEYQRSVRNLLALAVRVKQDPKMSMEIVDKVLANPSTPEYLKEDAGFWKQSIAKWQKEETRKQKPSLEKAKKLIAEGKSAQEYPLDGHSDVSYLRASAILHAYLDTTKGSAQLAEAMYHLGRSYEVLNDIGQWFLQDSYFESCIRTAPKTKIAERCYRRYELSQFMGYSGSAGMSLPEIEKERMKELKALAFGK
jgi:tetratricopeptide (TPR) repeat protein